MIVSWDWLKQYVPLEMPVEQLTDRLTMSGLNLEGVKSVGGDTAIDLEVTSNRPDCLGHLGVAREIGVLFERDLKIPLAQPATASDTTASATSVEIECEDLCPRYIARVIRGVKIGPSPAWLQQRLETLGIASINNVVDITNYVLMECGQPLHAFDFDKLNEQRIIVRRANKGEKIVAIDQKEYELTTETCVIADGNRPVAIAGVMGGLDTEIGDGTTNVLIETADFAPLSVRNTARALNLHSDSSYRFERGIDAEQLEWASRRCSELILEIAGGELLKDSLFAGKPVETERPEIAFRSAQLKRILGIDIPWDDAVRILKSLGIAPVGDVSPASGSFTPPSWRRDITREADLIEEVARIYGYDEIPADVSVPLSLSKKTHADRVVERLHTTLIAAGFCEAITLTFVDEESTAYFTPRGDHALLNVEHSSRRQENILRQSLVPSLLKARRENERRGNFNAQLFEISRVFLAADPGHPETEPKMLSLVSGRSFSELKGVVEAIIDSVNHHVSFSTSPSRVPQFAEGRGAELHVDGERLGWLGEIDRTVSDKLDLRDAVTVAELDISVLEEIANLTPLFTELPRFPTVSRDLNFMLSEETPWQQLEEVVRKSAGSLLCAVTFGGQYRGKQIPADQKSYIVTTHYRADRTLTNDEVEDAQQAVVKACVAELGAVHR